MTDTALVDVITKMLIRARNHVADVNAGWLIIPCTKVVYELDQLEERWLASLVLALELAPAGGADLAGRSPDVLKNLKLRVKFGGDRGYVIRASFDDPSGRRGDLAGRVDRFVFGASSQRHDSTRTTIRKLINAVGAPFVADVRDYCASIGAVRDALLVREEASQLDLFVVLAEVPRPPDGPAGERVE